MLVDENLENFVEILKRKVEIPKELKDNLNSYAYYDEEQEDDSILMVAEDSESYSYSTIEELKATPLSETFQELLFKFIDKSGLTDIEVYKKAFITRKLFSKIRSDKDYHPSFGTVTLLALALKLNFEEYEHLLKSASYSLATNSYSGITIKYCFEHKIYDVIDANNLFYSVTGKEIKDL